MKAGSITGASIHIPDLGLSTLQTVLLLECPVLDCPLYVPSVCAKKFLLLIEIAKCENALGNRTWNRMDILARNETPSCVPEAVRLWTKLWDNPDTCDEHPCPRSWPFEADPVSVFRFQNQNSRPDSCCSSCWGCSRTYFRPEIWSFCCWNRIRPWAFSCTSWQPFRCSITYSSRWHSAEK